jgi:large subunit ribosomal protein L9
MQLILLEKVRNLGDLGQTVNVKSGYGRNFLIPQGKAVFASNDNVNAFEARRAELEQKAAERLADAEVRAEKLQSLSLAVKALASDEGKLYGSVGPNELAEAIALSGVEVSRRDIIMPLGPIHETGDHQFDVQLHSDINITLSVSVDSQD